MTPLRILLIALIVLLLFGGLPLGYAHYGWGGGSGVGLLVIILIVVLLAGGG